MRCRTGWILSFALALMGAASAAAAEATRSRNGVAEWQELTRGKNLAAGRPVKFSSRPSYRLTADPHDALDLTDGQLVPRADGKIWFERGAVGWQAGADKGVDLTIDLGTEAAIGKIVARFLGGAEQNSLRLPAAVSVLLSSDGKKFFTAATTTKVNDGEKELAELQPARNFYFPETGTAFVAALPISIQATARHVVLRIKGATALLFLDEIAILESDAPSAVVPPHAFPPAAYVTEGVEIRPRQERLVITTNIVTPNFFGVEDARPSPAAGDETVFVFDLPEGIDLTAPPPIGLAQLPAKSDHRTRHEVRLRIGEKQRAAASFGPFYFQVATPGLDLRNAEAHFSWLEGGREKNRRTAKIEFVAIPEVPAPARRWDVSLTWMRGSMGWPGIFDAYRKLGFETFPIFPRNWTSAETKAEGEKLLVEARRKGLRIIYNESAFHVMSAKGVNHPEIRNQIAGRPGSTGLLCPAYTGKYYQEEISRVRRLAQMYRPDFVYFDIEIWQSSGKEAKRCSVCQAAFKDSSASSWEAFIKDQGTRMMKDLRGAVAGSAPDGKDPLVGLYNNHAAISVYHETFDFPKIYPAHVDVAQPSLYVQGNARLTHDVVRKNCELLGNRNIIPWLSTGTYGEFPSHRVEQIVLESFLNGARGLAYFQFSDFDPMDFFHHATALAKLSPHSATLADGRLLPARCSDPGLVVSAFGTRGEALLLVGNYGSPKPKSASITLESPVASAEEVVVNARGGAVDLRRLEIPPDGFRLVYVTFVGSQPARVR